MTRAFNNIFAAVQAEDEDLLTVLKENWPCLLEGEKPLIRVLLVASGNFTGSLGGFDAEDAGKVALFGEDGSLAATNFFHLFSGPGRTDVVDLDASGITGERTQSFVDGSGVLSLKVADAPATSGDAGLPGMWAADANFLYICVATNTWRRCDLSSW